MEAKKWNVAKFITLVIFLVSGTMLADEPHVPASDSEVLETLPATPFSRDQLAAVRQKLAQEPGNSQLATAAANSYIKMGNSTGDPRYYGYARSALKPWWDDAVPPVTVAKYRAQLKEKEHDYDGAIADLESILRREPENAQAWVELANNYRVKGNYAKAWAAADQLRQFGEEIQIAICRAPLMAVTGSAADAYDLLSKQLPVARKEFLDSVQWILIMQADLARILGFVDEADQHFRAALANEPDDSYAKRAYGEFLLDHDRPSVALEMLRESTNDNGVLLLATIAARRSGNLEQSDQWQFQLENRFQEIRLRGGQPHGRFEARYLLELKSDAEAALVVALANWEKQKEARDSRNVLEAALAANNAGAARAVLDFLKESRTEDVELQSLVRKLEGQ